jgi:membrane-associated phospholipid phosphatase
MTSKKHLLIAFITLSSMIVCYLFLDSRVAWWAHTHVTPQYHELFTTITEFGDSTYYLIGFGMAYLLFRFLCKKSDQANAALFLFASVAVSGIIADIIKIIAGRYRPSELFAQGHYGFDFFHIERALTSFPSGHTVTAFALATAITYLWPKTHSVMWVFAILIGISRLMIGAHYPSDVIAGAVVGIISTIIIIRYFYRKKDQSLSL